jgi:MinD-like ATPase involved in chromosome partitioning or flagellar assembly
MDPSRWELMGEELRAAGLEEEQKILSAMGWRKLFKLEESPDERRVRELKAVVDTPLRGTHSIVVLGGKGGAGKTTTAVGIGSTLAQLRNDKVVAIDGNPDVGANLAERIDPTTVSSYREILAAESLDRYADMRTHVGQSRASGLDVLGANRDVSDRKLLDTKTYLATHERLLRFYSVVVTDCGTNVEHPVSKGVLTNANSIVVVASATRDSAQATGRVMDWLREAGYHDLLARSVVVLNDVSGRADRKVIADLVSTFARRVGNDRVFVLPYDPHIGTAGVVDVDRLRPDTQRRFLEITAAVATNFSLPETG